MSKKDVRKTGSLGSIINRKAFMLMAIVVTLGVLWAMGFFVVHIGGGLIHILLVIALVVFIYNMLAGRRTL